jgi:CRP-like cAMP-binding protein
VSMAHLSNTATHRANRLLAALEPEDFAYLEPHLEIVDLHRRQVLYEAGETIRYTYFPHDAVVSLVNVLEDGGSVEVAVFGREGVFGLISALFTRESFGRYIVQIPGTASQSRSSGCARRSRPARACACCCTASPRRYWHRRFRSSPAMRFTASRPGAAAGF